MAAHVTERQLLDMLRKAERAAVAADRSRAEIIALCLQARIPSHKIALAQDEGAHSVQ